MLIELNSSVITTKTPLISPHPHVGRAPNGPGPPHYRGFTITLRHTALGRTPLNEWSALHRELYNTQHSQQTDIHAPSGIRTHNPSKRAATDRHLRPRGHCDRL